MKTWTSNKSLWIIRPHFCLFPNDLNPFTSNLQASHLPQGCDHHVASGGCWRKPKECWLCFLSVMAVCKRLLLLCFTSRTLWASPPHSRVWDLLAAAVHAPANVSGVPALNGRVLATLVTLRLVSAQKVLHRGCLLLAFGHHRSWVKIWKTRWKTTRKRFILARQSGKSSWIKWSKSPGVGGAVGGFCWAIWKISQNCIQDSNFYTMTKDNRADKL